jgi:subtilase family serine protease
LVRFAQSNHLAIVGRHANRLLLDVSGSVSDIERAFKMRLLTYPHPTEDRDFYAPDVDPAIEAQLPLLDVSGLNNYIRPHPHSVQLSDMQAAANAVPRSGSATNGAYQGNDFRAAYVPAVKWTGAGQALGLVQFDGFYSNDIAAYETAAGLPHVPLQTVLLDGYDGSPTTGSKSGNAEVSLDIEMAISMAPGLSKVVVFEAGPGGLQNDILSAMASHNRLCKPGPLFHRQERRHLCPGLP